MPSACDTLSAYGSRNAILSFHTSDVYSDKADIRTRYTKPLELSSPSEGSVMRTSPSNQANDQMQGCKEHQTTRSSQGKRERVLTREKNRANSNIQYRAQRSGVAHGLTDYGSICMRWSARNGVGDCGQLECHGADPAGGGNCHLNRWVYRILAEKKIRRLNATWYRVPLQPVGLSE